MSRKLGLAILVVFLALGLSAMLIMIREDKAESSINSIPSNNNANPIISNSTIVNSSNPSTSSGISLSDLAVHNSASTCWVIYSGKVYDLTSFLPNHPGSAGAIIPYCGTDGFEAAFVAQHGTRKVSMLMKVGILIGDFKIVGNTA